MYIKTMDVLIKLINSVGFPIVMCCGLFWILVTILYDVLENTQQLAIVITQNTEALNMLIVKIGYM